MKSIFEPEKIPANAFLTDIKVYLTSTETTTASAPTPTPETVAIRAINTINASSDPASALWQFWDAFFVTVATTSTSHAPMLALLLALQAQPPTRPHHDFIETDAARRLRSYSETDGRLHWTTLPRFSSQWRDTHDILEARRDWSHVSGGELFLRFCTFSALILKSTQGKVGLHPIQVFYACRNVLECKKYHGHDPTAHTVPLVQLRALDILVTAIWVRDGGLALLKIDYTELQQYWDVALNEETGSWPANVGLTKERWQMWQEKLRAFISGDYLNADPKKVVAEAIEVLESLLAF